MECSVERLSYSDIRWVFVIVAYSVGYGFDSLLWTKFHINYKFIFGFDLRNTIRSYEYLEFIGWISLIFTGLFLFSTSKYCPQDSITQAAILLGLLGCMLVVISLPFKIFRYSARLWFLKTMVRDFYSLFRVGQCIDNSMA